MPPHTPKPARPYPLLAPFRAFLPAAMPPMSRRNYRWELTSSFLMPVLVACVEGNVVGVIAKQGFIGRLGDGADPAMNYVVAALAAAGPLGNLTSVLWTRLFHGRDRVRCTNVLQIGVGCCVAGLAAAPFNRAGIVMLVAFTMIARALLTGIIIARSDVWRANYPRSARARATGRITIVATTMVSLTALAIAAMMDVPALAGHGYRIVCLAALVIGGFGAWAYSRIRWRGRGRHIARERADVDALTLPGARSMLRVLRDDRWYRRFMIAQFILGAPNLAATAVFIIAVADVFHPSYTKAIVLTQVIPTLVPIAVIPLWARLLDRVHVVRFRTIHSWFFVAANLLMGTAMLSESQPILFASRLALGVAFAGGLLAWSLGHHDFATRELASIYMGIHATLTGVRGFLAPFLGTLLYLGVHAQLLGVTVTVPGLGGGSFLVFAAIGAVAAILFWRMDVQLARAAIGAPGD